MTSNYSKILGRFGLGASTTTLALGLVLGATPAFAQEAPAPSSATATPAPSANDTSETIVVTGSRIANPNLTSTSPLTVVSGTEAKLQGTTRVEDLLNSLPQVFAAEGSSDANGASGIATVDLRDLGSSRTLVLINGRRLVPGDPTDPVADLNFIPAALIKQVDVLTGGASSVYGSDAVAGVVNFVMDKDFEGVRVDAQYSMYQHDNRQGGTLLNALQTGQGGITRNYANLFPRGNTVDGFQKNVTLTIGGGTADGRGHITAYAGWRQVDAVTQGDRDYSYCGASDGTYQLNAVTGVGTPGLAYCGGSSTTDVGRFRRTQNVGLGATPVYAAFGTSYTTDPANPGAFRTYSASRDQFNFNPYNYYQRPDERYTLGAFAHYEVSKAFDPYLEVMFMDDRTRAQIAPSGAFYATDFFINCNNPLISAAQRTQLCGANAGTATLQSLYIGRRNVEGGGRIDDLRHTDYRIVVGAKGEIGKGINYDVYGRMGRAILAENYLNDFSRARINRALNVVTSPTTGQPVCASAIPNAQGVVIDPLCVPYNIFTPGGVTQAALNYLQVPTFQQGQTTEYVASGSVSADLGEYGFTSPWATDGVALAVGAEYRKEVISITRDIEDLTGDRAGAGTPFGVPNVSGAFDVKEEFAELEIPLIADKPYLYAASINASYRHSDYSISGKTNTYKIGGTITPIRGISLRGAYNRAVRAPNVLNLFSPANVQLFSGTDPCAGAAVGGLVNGNTLAQCARTGVTAAQFGLIDPSPASQYNQRTAGNQNLVPEIADTYTVGAVFNPSFMHSFVLTVDGYDIRIKRLIATVGANFALGQCLATGSAFYCSRVQRSADGSLFTGASFVDNPTQNLGSERTRGIDVTANYRLDLNRVGVHGLGSLNFDLVGTYLDYFKVQPLPGNPSYDCAGKFGLSCGTPLPKWRHKLRVTWNMPDGFQLSGAWRFFSRVHNDNQSGDPQLASPSIAGDPLTNHIKPVSYFDLALTSRIAEKYTFRVGVQNILDRSPPITYEYNSNGSNTYAQVYDSLGRYIYAGVTFDF